MVARQQLVVASSADTDCTELRCALLLRAQELLLDGPLTGGDISVISDGNMAIGASISADAMGWDAEQGDGAGESVDSWTGSSSSSYRRDDQSASGSGGGHGGNGGDSCWQGACNRAFALACSSGDSDPVCCVCAQATGKAALQWAGRQ